MSADLSYTHVLRGFATSLESTESVEGAMDILQDVGQRLGFPLVDYACMRGARRADGSWKAPNMKTRNFPSNWDRRFESHRSHDPYYHASFAGTQIVDWAAVQKASDALSEPEISCLDYISDVGLTKGLTVPIHMPGNCFAFLSFIGERNAVGPCNINEECQNALWLISRYFHGRMSAYTAPTSHEPKELTWREEQCLYWCAEGKNLQDIGDILDISLETVRTYLKRANSKLNALNRSHAIAKAICLGLIDPPRL